MAQAEATFGPIHAVINNAGVTATKPALDQDERSWDSVVDTNLKGVWLVAQAAARRMVASKMKGSIVNIASILGLRVAGAVAPYAISKAGVIQMTKALALEWARYGIRVNALAPGYFMTELNDDFFESDAGKSLIKRVPQRRLGQLTELDGPLLLLISNAGSFMTGSVVTVDGGHMVSGL
jgi:NAD(P)-dependent dehydrogenase (short-subunit alcohol dehydrogenase family)